MDTAQRQPGSEGQQRQFPMEPVAGGPAGDATGSKVEPALASRRYGKCRHPISGSAKLRTSLDLRFGATGKACELSVAVRFEAPPLPCLQAVPFYSHQPGDPMTTDGDPVIAKLARVMRGLP